MPNKSMQTCNYPGCSALTVNRFCAKHEKQVNKEEDRNRSTSRQRGYDTRWNKVRRMKMKHNPLCEMCLQEGRVRAAELVHHIKPISQGGEILTMSNLMSVCRACHGRLHETKRG